MNPQIIYCNSYFITFTEQCNAQDDKLILAMFSLVIVGLWKSKCYTERYQTCGGFGEEGSESC